ncbi:MAG TPA: HAMP domain-containing protein [Gemmatimonadota bacterium]|nr:HAMP domain-containing protein [Gemmatimonadota bacterium]
MGLAWVVVAALVSATIVRVALAPLRHLEAAAARIERGELNARVSHSRLADRDIARLIRAFNQALDQQVAYRERLRELARRSLRSEEASGRRIAVELREGPGQRLAALLLRLRLVEQGGGLGSVGDMIEEARGEIATALDIVGKHPGDRVERLLDDLGLRGAVEWQARQAAREHGLDVSVAMDDVDVALSRPARISLLVLLEEALENLGRQATACAARVRICHATGNRIVAELLHDGPCQNLYGEIGLLRMEERIGALGGELEVTSDSTRGTCLKAEIPVRPWCECGENSDTVGQRSPDRPATAGKV